MKFKRNRELEKGKLDLTPLVDVVFLLLLFFLLSSSFIFQPGIKVNLPKSVAAAPQSRNHLAIITITQEEKVVFNNELTTFEGLRRRLKAAVKKNPQGSLVIKADVDVRHGRVVEIMSVAKQAGINSLSIATEPLEIQEKIFLENEMVE